jgi:chromosome segregation ATPase
LNDKPVPSEASALGKLLEGNNPTSGVDAIVIRKGKQVVVKGLVPPKAAAATSTPVPDWKLQRALKRLQETREGLRGVQHRLKDLEMQRSVLEKKLPAVTVTQQEVQEAIEQDESLRAMLADIVDLLDTIEGTAATVKGGYDSPRVKKLVEQLNSLKESEAARRKVLAPLAANQLEEKKRSAREAALADPDKQIAASRALAEVLEEEIAELEERVQRLMKAKK